MFNHAILLLIIFLMAINNTTSMIYKLQIGGE